MKSAAEYHEGKITFDEFARRNAKDWQRMARYLLRRFPFESMVEDDVVQELLIGSWQAMKKFDPTRSADADKFVVFRGLSHAKKRMFRVLRSPEEPLANEGDTIEAHAPAEPSEQFEELARMQRLRALVDGCTKLTDAVCLIAYYREEDCLGAATSLYTDPEMRRLCRFGSLPDAARKMRRVLQHIHPHEEQEHGHQTSS